MKRISWVDTFKCICIMAVMAEHAQCMTGWVHAFNAPFFVNGFFFASGYVYRNGESFGSFFKKKLRQLFVPWLVFSFLIIISSHLLSFSPSIHTDLKKELLENLLQIRYRGDEMWFVAALFAAYIPFFFFVKFYEKAEGKRHRTVLFISIGLALSLAGYYFEMGGFGNSVEYLPWHGEFAFRAMFLMFAGYLFRENWEPLFDRLNTQANRILLWTVFLLMVFVPQLSAAVYPVVNTVFYTYISPLIGIPAVISLCKQLKPGKFSSFVGRNTLAFYGLHGKVEAVIHAALIRSPWMYEYNDLCCCFAESLWKTALATLCSWLVALLTAALLILPVMIIEKYFPVLEGKKMPERKK